MVDSKLRPSSDAGLHTHRITVVLWFAIFMVTWTLSLDQTVFFACLSGWLFNQGRSAFGTTRIPATIAYPLIAVFVLAVGAFFWSEYSGNAARTAVVWGTGVLAAVAYYNANACRRAIVAQVLLTIWVASLAVYVVALFSPAIARDLLSIKVYSGFSSSRQFYTPSFFFDIEVFRPVGFALYANELALFGILASALYLAQQQVSVVWSRVILAMMVVGLLLSTSRSLVLTYGLVIVLVAVVRPRETSSRRLEDMVLRTISVAAVVATVYALRPAIYDDMRSWLNDLTGARLGGSADLRSLSYEQGQRIFLENMWTGIGGLPQHGHIQIGSHSLPLSLAVRHGLTGIVPLIALYVVTVGLAAWAIYQRNSSVARLGAVLIVSVIASITIQFDDDMLSFVSFVLVLAELARRIAEVRSDSGAPKRSLYSAG